MSILKTEYMSRKELEFFRAVEEFSERLYKAYCETMSEEELAFGNHVYEILNNYSWNLFEQNKLNELIYSIGDPEEWKAFFKNRAVRLGSLYEENEAILREVRECLEKPMSKVIAGFWCEMLRIHFNNRGISDLHCTLPILEKIIPVLEEYEDWQGMCMAYVFYSNFYFVTMLNLADESPYSYARKLISVREHYPEMKTPYSIYQAYANIYTYGLKNGTVSPQESYELVVEMKQFFESQQLEEPLKQRCFMVWETCTDYWLAAINPYVDEAGKEPREFYCELAKRRYGELERENVPLEERLFPYYAYALHAETLSGEASWDSALERLYEYYSDNYVQYFESPETDADPQVREDFERQNISCGINENQEIMNSLLETVGIMERWLRRCRDRALVRRVTERLIADIPKFYHFYTSVPLETSQELTSLCFAFLPYLEGADRKERWILELVTKKQFATHLHSVMVQKIAVAVTTSLYRERPELFDQVKEQIGDRDLLDFVAKCALFHDVGKNDIATIVNVQARALDNMEFAAITRHPYFGYHRFMEDPDFSCYKDVILFHHKTYDGKGGYPADMDNTTSPYKLISDLITICDCFDAATDTLGRNYKRAKTVDELIGELVRDAGTRYNPDIVRHIDSDQALRQELERLIVDERIDIAYEIAYEYQ